MRSGRGVRSAIVTVGREAENDILARALDGARAGQPGCTLLAGEGGVGKSRLLHEAAAAARQAGLGVAAARIGGLAIMAALRPAESALADELVRAWRGDDVATVVELEALDQRATCDLVRHLLGAAPPGELVADVLARTDGVPLLVEEV